MNQALPRMITRKELRQLVPYCPQHILRLEKAGKFPKRIHIGPRRVGWWLHEVLAWIASRTGAPGGQQSARPLPVEVEAQSRRLSAE